MSKFEQEFKKHRSSCLQNGLIYLDNLLKQNRHPVKGCILVV